MIEDDSTPSERLEQSIKTPCPTDPEDDEKWNALLTALTSEFDEHEQAFADVRDAKFVDTATEAQLEKLAGLFELDRRTNEDVDEFRARIKVALRTQTTSATLSEIREMIAVLMAIDPSSIELQEPDDEILWLEPRIPADAVGQSNVRPNFLDELLADATAAGVNANTLLLADRVMVHTSTWRTMSATPRTTGLSASEYPALSTGHLALSRKTSATPTHNVMSPINTIAITLDTTISTRAIDRLSSGSLGELSDGTFLN